jgi:hypothetical protein
LFALDIETVQARWKVSEDHRPIAKYRGSNWDIYGGTVIGQRACTDPCSPQTYPARLNAECPKRHIASTLSEDFETAAINCGDSEIDVIYRVGCYSRAWPWPKYPEASIVDVDQYGDWIPAQYVENSD